MAMGQGKEHEVEDLGGILSRLTDLVSLIPTLYFFLVYHHMDF